VIIQSLPIYEKFYCNRAISVSIATCHPSFYPVFLPPLFQVFLEAEVFVFVAEPEVVFAAAELFPEVFVFAVEPEVVFAAAELEVVFAAAELSPEVFVFAAEPEVVFAAAELSPEVFVFAAEPEVVFVVDLDVSEPRASVDIAVAFVVLVPVSVVVVEVDSSGRPKFHAFPNVDHFARPSSSVGVVG
jgi:hypothetical protein